MRRMSFRLTWPQMKARTKTVTRRLGWRFAEVADLVLPAWKTMGIRPGELVELLDPIQFTAVRRERLDLITIEDVIAEGFPDLTPAEFVAMFCDAAKCNGATVVTRIAFDHLGAR